MRASKSRWELLYFTNDLHVCCGRLSSVPCLYPSIWCLQNLKAWYPPLMSIGQAPCCYVFGLQVVTQAHVSIVSLLITIPAEELTTETKTIEISWTVCYRNVVNLYCKEITNVYFLPQLSPIAGCFNQSTLKIIHVQLINSLFPLPFGTPMALWVSLSSRDCSMWLHHAR